MPFQVDVQFSLGRQEASKEAVVPPAGRDGQRVPVGRIETLHAELVQRRQIREHGAALQRPHREWSELSGLEMRLGRQDGRDARVRLTADDIDQGRGRALVQHDIELLT